MRKLLIFAFVGFFAQLIDGALGMAFGLSSSSLLLAYGVAPAIASSSIHMSEIATTAVSGYSHYKFNNVDKRLVFTLVIPGAISAFLGAAFLSSLPGEMIKPFISTFLLLLGFYIVIRFLFLNPESAPRQQFSIRKRFIYPLGFLAGFLDAIGGGGWGPINTPVLLSQKGAVPRKVIGTVDTSEFAVTIAATLGFGLFLGWEQFSWIWVAAFVIGGVLAAPLAAWLVQVIPALILGVLAGGFIILTNLRTLLITLNVTTNQLYTLYAFLIIGWVLAVYAACKKHMKSRSDELMYTQKEEKIAK
ncbi:sulfite exporter TauE/SafE family protein [Halobacillus yeomjeoni]|uniref:Probable membrane transporter protein n=1 Tax=Halobacillus yeomjeoni TaxID=311194 RepID=A0A931MUA4_9BACI|nr:sulfite exporter TauE/SafE family protein [Halobacillus yeomjeoni]MBH0229467.1 sulfite exporter TauE/SafE family protein [Halobacillus yeomjeoni]